MIKNIFNEKFGKLIPIKYIGKNKKEDDIWLCKCDCGKQKEINSYNLRSGNTKSCGCLRVQQAFRTGKANKTHGYTKTQIYRVWANMIDRCTDHNSPAYKDYGGRGIAICKRWLKFENFLKDMGESPTDKHQIDRIDNNFGYYKENCRWATREEQNKNKRNNRNYLFNNKNQCVSTWAKEYNIPYRILYRRLCIDKWPIEKALIIPVRKNKKNMKEIKQFQPIRRFKDAWAVFKTIRKGNLGPGKVCSQLEEEIKKLTGAKYCFTTTSGTVGLMMAIESLDLPKGSTILFPAYTFLAGANAARFLGYKIKLIDINPYTLCLDPDKLKWNKNIGCVIFVSHNGYSGSGIQLTRQFCYDNNIPMIEDSCQSIGIRWAGMVGNVGIFSFSVPKLITGGQGGAVITNSDKIAKRLEQIRDHGGNWRKDRTHKYIGVNFRYNDIQASYVLSQLKDIKSLLKKRWQIFYNYHINGITPHRFSPYTEIKESGWMVIYKSKKADKIIEELSKNGIQAVKYYKSINENPPYKTKEKFSDAKQISKELTYLPSSLNLTKRQIRKICNIIKKVEENE